MGLFDLFKPKNEISFTQAEHFKGFKSFPLVNHGHKESEEGLKKLSKKTKDFDLSGCKIRFIVFTYDGNRQGVAVYVDDMQVGTYFGQNKNELARAVLEKKISAAHVRVDTLKKNGAIAYGAIVFVKLEE